MNTLRYIIAGVILIGTTAILSSQINMRGNQGASSPRWVAPAVVDAYSNRDTAALSMHYPMLQWMMPVDNNSSLPVNFTYDLKIVEAMPGQDPVEAIKRNPVAYQLRQLMAPQCLIPVNVIKMFNPDMVYVAQVTARAPQVRLQNEGRSDLLIFRVTDLK